MGARAATDRTGVPPAGRWSGRNIAVTFNTNGGGSDGRGGGDLEIWLSGIWLDRECEWSRLRFNMQPEHPPQAAWFAILIPILIMLALWDGVWKAIAMWKSGRNNQLAWFICLAIFNTVGILPIIYLLWGQRNRNPQPPVTA